MKKLPKKSIKTKNRIAELVNNLKCYKESIELLYAFAQGKETLKNKGYSDLAEQYQRTKEDDERMQWTLKNIRLQMALLNREFETLIKYGK